MHILPMAQEILHGNRRRYPGFDLVRFNVVRCTETGHPLPTMAELAERSQVDLSTAQRAVAELLLKVDISKARQPDESWSANGQHLMNHGAIAHTRADYRTGVSWFDNQSPSPR